MTHQLTIDSDNTKEKEPVSTDTHTNDNMHAQHLRRYGVVGYRSHKLIKRIHQDIKFCDQIVRLDPMIRK